MCRVTAVLIALLFASVAYADTQYYLVDSIATQASDADVRAEAAGLEKIYADLERASGVQAHLLFSTDPAINALSFELHGEKYVIVQAGVLALLENDRDAVAAVLGHELGHHKAGHLRAGQRKKKAARVVGTILGAIIGAKLGGDDHGAAGAILGAGAGNVGGNLVALKFNRNQEMEADRLAVGWMIAAGYNPEGMVRVQQDLARLEGGSAPATMFRTHPPSAKRNQAAQQLIAQLAPSRELLDKPILPIASADAVAIAADEIQHENAAALAAVLDPGLGEVPAAALAPIGSVGFDDYAALANEVQYVGQSKALAHHKLSKKRLDAINEGFTARMQASPALRERYTIAFYRATQGRFAAYGRDLADSYAKHQDLHFEPPFPLQRMLTLNAALAQADGELDPRVLAAAGLTSYEAMIGRAWWMRKAMVLALTGDTSLITRLRAAARGDSDEQRMTQAESAGVRIGGNVHVGEGVHVGSRSGANGSSVGAEP